MNNQPGTPREDGEMGGNFLNPFQSESVSQTRVFLALLPVEAFLLETVLTALLFLRVSAVFPKHDHERLKAPAARWRSHSGGEGGLIPLLPSPPPPAESGGHLLLHLCTTAPIPHPTHAHAPPS